MGHVQTRQPEDTYKREERLWSSSPYFLHINDNKTELFRQLTQSLGPQKSRTFPVFHAFTGCDTVSFFDGKSKKSAWEMWNVFPDVTNSFLEITSAPSELSDVCTRNIERFVVLL